MANLKSLGYISIADKSREEALEELRQIRLSRRVPVKTTKTRTVTKKQEKKLTKDQIDKGMSPDLAAELLALIGGTE